ncbi:MAG: hypothetical protein IIB87_02385 [Chloroflexi bacterium]|nr:hypothetical protein [Chloroflexota bacterium]
MKYIIQAEIDPETGIDVEAQPEKLQEMIGQWQALNPIGMYFALTRRAITIIVDVPNEDALFEALHGMWGLTKDYPDVWPVTSAEEFPALLQRTGIGG